MGLEAATHVGDLVSSNPDGADGKFEGDNHIRLIKAALQATFPGMAGRSWREQSKGANYTVIANDNMSVIRCTTSLTLALTAAATLGNGHMFFIIVDAGIATIDPNAAETVNGLAEVGVIAGSFAIVMCNGSSFKLIEIPVTSSLWSSGDVKATFKVSADPGWVMMNDGTIGNAASGGTTRANADTRNLFILLYSNIADSICPVSGGRSGNAVNDFNANKTLTIPKALGRALSGSGTGVGLGVKVLGANDGGPSVTLGFDTMPNYTLTVAGLSIPALGIASQAVSGSVGVDSGNFNGATSKAVSVADTTNHLTPSGGSQPNVTGATAGGATNTGTTGAGVTSALGGGGSFGIVQPTFYANFMIKL